MTLYLTGNGIYTTILSAMQNGCIIRRVWFNANHKARVNTSFGDWHLTIPHIRRVQA